MLQAKLDGYGFRVIFKQLQSAYSEYLLYSFTDLRMKTINLVADDSSKFLDFAKYRQSTKDMKDINTQNRHIFRSTDIKEIFSDIF